MYHEHLSNTNSLLLFRGSLQAAVILIYIRDSVRLGFIICRYYVDRFNAGDWASSGCVLVLSVKIVCMGQHFCRMHASQYICIIYKVK